MPERGRHFNGATDSLREKQECTGGSEALDCTQDDLTGVALCWERCRHITKVECLWRLEAMMLHEHVFLGKALRSGPQRVCSMEMAGKQLTIKALRFSKPYFYGQPNYRCLLLRYGKIQTVTALQYTKFFSNLFRNRQTTNKINANIIRILMSN